MNSLRWWRPWRLFVVYPLCDLAKFLRWDWAQDRLLDYLFPSTDDYVISFDPGPMTAPDVKPLDAAEEA